MTSRRALIAALLAAAMSLPYSCSGGTSTATGVAATEHVAFAVRNASGGEELCTAGLAATYARRFLTAHGSAAPLGPILREASTERILFVLRESTGDRLYTVDPAANPPEPVRLTAADGESIAALWLATPGRVAVQLTDAAGATQLRSAAADASATTVDLTRNPDPGATLAPWSPAWITPQGEALFSLTGTDGTPRSYATPLTGGLRRELASPAAAGSSFVGLASVPALPQDLVAPLRSEEHVFRFELDANGHVTVFAHDLAQLEQSRALHAVPFARIESALLQGGALVLVTATSPTDPTERVVALDPALAQQTPVALSSLANGADVGSIAASPDGDLVVFVAATGGAPVQPEAWSVSVSRASSLRLGVLPGIPSLDLVGTPGFFGAHVVFPVWMHVHVAELARADTLTDLRVLAPETASAVYQRPLAAGEAGPNVAPAHWIVDGGFALLQRTWQDFWTLEAGPSSPVATRLTQTNVHDPNVLRPLAGSCAGRWLVRRQVGAHEALFSFDPAQALSELQLTSGQAALEQLALRAGVPWAFLVSGGGVQRVAVDRPYTAAGSSVTLLDQDATLTNIRIEAVTDENVVLAAQRSGRHVLLYVPQQPDRPGAIELTAGLAHDARFALWW